MNNTEKYLCILIVSLAIAIAVLSGCGQMNGGQMCRRFADKTLFVLDEKNAGVGCPKGSEPVEPTDVPTPIDEPALNPDQQNRPQQNPSSNPNPPTDEATPPTDEETPPTEEETPPTDDCGDKEGDHGNADNENSQGNEHKNCNGTQQI